MIFEERAHQPRGERRINGDSLAVAVVVVEARLAERVEPEQNVRDAERALGEHYDINAMPFHEARHSVEARALPQVPEQKREHLSARC